MSIGIGLFGVAGPKLRAHLGSVPRSLRSRARRVGKYSALPIGRKRAEEGARDLAHTAPQPGRMPARGGRSCPRGGVGWCRRRRPRLDRCPIRPNSLPGEFLRRNEDREKKDRAHDLPRFLSYSTKQPISLAALSYCLQWFRLHIRRSVPGKGGVTWFLRIYGGGRRGFT